LGHAVHRERAERLTRVNGIGGRHPRRGKRTTVPGRLAPPAPDLVRAGRLDEKWCGDITHAQVGGTWSRLACVINHRTRKALGRKTPAEVFAEQLRSIRQPGAATTG